MIPRNRHCIPPTKHTRQASDAQPATECPAIAAITAQIMPMNDRSVMNSPAKNTMRIGLTDRLVMPSNASASIFFSG